MTRTNSINKNGCSVCKAGDENYTECVLGPFRGKTYYQYDYRHKDGELFSTLRPTLEQCRQERDKWLTRHLIRNSARQEIRQGGIVIVWSDDKVSMPMVFGNLTGRNITDPAEYREYVLSRMDDSTLKYGEIELVADGVTVATGTIRENI